MRILTLFTFIFLVSCNKKDIPVPTPVACPYPAVTTSSVHLAMGNPSQATITQPNNYLLDKAQYALSYNRSLVHANWAAWHLNLQDLGGAERADDFRPDPTLSLDWIIAKPLDYQGSGFDRGHLCPSADRTATDLDNSSTFLMTNMIPQSPDLNRNTWESLESYCRQLVKQENELYIYAGTYGSGGTGTAGDTTLVKGKINVPAACWKVVLILPEGENDIHRVTSSTQTIAVWIPNRQDLDNSWKTYKISVDEIETRTGYDFFSHLPLCIQYEIERIISPL